jgi:uroporphyrin-III C-methyltransferase
LESKAKALKFKFGVQSESFEIFHSGRIIMTTDTEQTTIEPSPRKKRHWMFFFLLLIVLLGGTIVLSYPFWQKLTDSQTGLQQEVQVLTQQVMTLQAELQTLQSQDHEAPLEALQARFEDLSQQQQVLKNYLTNLIHQVEQQPQSDDDWKLAEINYLLTIALHRLQLAHDPEGALIALLALDKRLQRFNKANWLPVRTQLLEDIKRLQEVEYPDITGLAVLLAQYINEVDELPLLQGHQTAVMPESEKNPLPEKQPWQEQLLDELQQLFVIRYNRDADSGFLTPEQRALVTQILHLKLENVRYFLLRRDSDNFVASIKAVHNWLKRYYDQNDEKVKGLQNDLAQMQTIALNPQLPDISGSLNVLQRLSAPSMLPDLEQELGETHSEEDLMGEIPLITEEKTENSQNTETEVAQ